MDLGDRLGHEKAQVLLDLELLADAALSAVTGVVSYRGLPVYS